MITITIAGPHKSGKTRLASLLTDLLFSAGYDNVEVVDDDPRYFGNDPSRMDEIDERQPEYHVDFKAILAVAAADYRLRHLLPVRVVTTATKS